MAGIFVMSFTLLVLIFLGVSLFVDWHRNRPVITRREIRKAREDWLTGSSKSDNES